MIDMLKDLKGKRWFCSYCKEETPSSSNELRYFVEVDFVYHYHPEHDLYFRAFELIGKDRIKTPQFDPKTGRMSAPVIKVEGDNLFVAPPSFSFVRVEYIKNHIKEYPYKIKRERD